MRKVLRALGHVTREGVIALKGRAACELNTADELVVGELLMEGVRRMDEMEFFRSRVPSTAHVPVVAKDDPPKEDDPTFVVWAAIDGVRTVDEVARAAGLELFDAMRGVYELVKRGRVTVREP